MKNCRIPGLKPWLLWGLAFAACPLVRAEELICPPTLEVRQALSSNAPMPWQARIDPSPHALAGITLFDGSPDQQASLVPDKDIPSGQRNRLATWTLGSLGGALWLSCRYLDTAVTLERQLPTSYQTCQLLYGPGGTVIRLSCH